MMGFFFGDPEDPGLNFDLLLFHHARQGSISGMEEALGRGANIDSSFTPSGDTALHFAASCSGRAGTDAVIWLLKRGIGWYKQNGRGLIEEQVAKENGNEASSVVLGEWYIHSTYEIHYMTFGGEDPNNRTAIQSLRIDKDCENREFCLSPVVYTKPPAAPDGEVAMICTGDGVYGTGIMMEWERPIIRESARLLLDKMPTSELRVLNIGFGIGMIDTYFQDAHPAEHVIIEAHPQCLQWMRKNGWYDRPGVRILEGRWQDFLVASPSTLDFKDAVRPVDIGKFDAVYFDTFAEGYHGHFAFIQHVPRLLRGPRSRFSFFENHPHPLYREVATRHHNDMGMNTEWHAVHVDTKRVWKAIQKYGQGAGPEDERTFFIPVCALAPTVPRTVVPGVGWKSDIARKK